MPLPCVSIHASSASSLSNTGSTRQVRTSSNAKRFLIQIANHVINGLFDILARFVNIGAFFAGLALHSVPVTHPLHLQRASVFTVTESILPSASRDEVVQLHGRRFNGTRVAHLLGLPSLSAASSSARAMSCCNSLMVA